MRNPTGFFPRLSVLALLLTLLPAEAGAGWLFRRNRVPRDPAAAAQIRVTLERARINEEMKGYRCLTDREKYGSSQAEGSEATLIGLRNEGDYLFKQDCVFHRTNVQKGTTPTDRQISVYQTTFFTSIGHALPICRCGYLEKYIDIDVPLSAN